MTKLAEDSQAARSGATVQAVERALDLLLLLGEAERGVIEVAAELAVNKSTASRLLSTLLTRGFVTRDPVTARFRPGPRLAALGHVYLEGLRPERELRPILERLAEATGEGALLTILDGDRAVYVDKVESRHSLRTHSRIGQEAPLHAGAAGKAIVAFLPREQVERLLGSGPLPRFTPRTIVDRRKLFAHLAEVREQGYAPSVEEIDAGVVGFGVPLLGWDGRPVGALSVTGPLARLDEARQARVLTRLRQAVGEWQRSVRAGADTNGHGAIAQEGER